MTLRIFLVCLGFVGAMTMAWADDEAPKLKPETVAAMDRAKAALEKEEYEAAAEAAEEAFQSDPQQSAPVDLLAGIHLEWGRDLVGKDRFSEAREHLRRARLYARDNDLVEETQEASDKIAQWTADGIRDLQRRHDLDKAIALADEAIAWGGDDPGLLHRARIEVYKEVGNPLDLLRAYNAACAWEGRGAADNLARAFALTGRRELVTKLFEEMSTRESAGEDVTAGRKAVLPLLQEAASEASAGDEPHLWLANLYADLQRWRDADGELLAAIKAAGDDAAKVAQYTGFRQKFEKLREFKRAAGPAATVALRLNAPVNALLAAVRRNREHREPELEAQLPPPQQTRLRQLRSLIGDEEVYQRRLDQAVAELKSIRAEIAEIRRRKETERSTLESLDERNSAATAAGEKAQADLAHTRSEIDSIMGNFWHS